MLDSRKAIFAAFFLIITSFSVLFADSMDIYGSGGNSNLVIIDSQEIMESPANDILDILISVAGVYVNRSGNEVTLFFRGVDSTRILILVNGRKLSPLIDLEMIFSFIPLSMVERIEIIKGNASSIYGDDAIGGAINIVTKDGASSIPGTFVNIGFGTSGLMILDFFNSDFLKNNMFYSLGVKGLIDAGRFPGLSRDFFDIYSAAMNFSIAFSGKKLIDNSSSLDFLLPFAFQQKGRQGSTQFPDDTANLNKLFFSPTIGWEKKVEKGKILIGFGLNLSSLDYYDSDNSAGVLSFRNFNYGSNLDIAYLLKSDKTAGHLKFGIQAEGLSSSKFISDNLEEGAGVIGRFRLHGNGGFRVSKNGSEKDFFQGFLNAGGASSFDFFSSHLSVRGSGNLEAGFLIVSSYDNFSSLRVSSGFAMKQPSFQDLFWPSSSFAVGNLALRPEEMFFIDSELTIKLKKLGSVKLNLFYQDISDYILWNQGPGGLWRPSNLESVVSFGYDFSLNILVFTKNLSSFNMNFNFSTLFCYDNDADSSSFLNQLPLRPFNIFSISLKYKTEEGHLFLISGSYTGQRYLNISNTDYRDGWVLFSFMMNLTITQNIKFLISGENFVIGEPFDFEDLPMRRPNLKIGLRVTI
ncbi:MAG: TonB-dependent receptor plug domain-containing protein [Spirochaetales bacterium]|nr:TonB-dependent receptor plug domain-containing protein [Spirochaetales bacterium]